MKEKQARDEEGNKKGDEGLLEYLEDIIGTVDYEEKIEFHAKKLEEAIEKKNKSLLEYQEAAEAVDNL